MSRILAAVIAGLVLLQPVAVVRADDITDQIGEALAAYNKHDLATTAAALEAASSLVRQAKAESWKALLPPPLDGWSAEDAKSMAVGNAMFGGGTNVSRRYTMGGQSVEISFVADSPLMQGLGSLMSSGMMTGSDMKLLIIDGRKVTYKKDENSLTTMAGKVLVAIKGQAVDEPTLRAYFKAVNLADLEKASAG